MRVFAIVATLCLCHCVSPDGATSFVDPALVDDDSQETSNSNARIAVGAHEDELFALDIHWVHPLAAPMRLPQRHSQMFGAERPGPRPRECGAGHCGVDLASSVGEPVYAAADGVVARMQRDDSGRSGRYIVLLHRDRFETAYIHLDEVAAEIEVGDSIERGMVIGTSGSSGVLRSQPHLHFSLAVTSDDERTYIDPLRLLERADVLEERMPPHDHGLPIASDELIVGAVDWSAARAPRECEAQISGEVRDENGERVRGAVVYLGGTERITDARGRFLFDRVAPGELEIFAEDDELTGSVRIGVARCDRTSTLQINIR